MPKKGKEQEKKDDVWSAGKIGVTRIETITDGVLAIAMTILVLELSMEPEILEAIADGHFSKIYTEIIGYMLGFMVLGVYYVVHKFMFHHIKRSDGVLSWLNILFLMFAALVPLSTKVNNADATNHSLLFFYMTAVISMWVLLAMWKYATMGYRLVDKNIDKLDIDFVTYTTIISTGSFGIVAIGQFFVPVLGYLGFIVLGYVIIATAYGHYIPFSSRSSGA